MALEKNNITEDTVSNVALGPGIVVANLQFSGSAWTYDAILGATSGGSTLKIEPEIMQITIDGATVAFEGQDVKVGGTATLETNLAEVTHENLKLVTLAKEGTGVTGFNELVDKPSIEANDYIDNLGYIGYKLNGDPIIFKFDKALCTTGLDFSGKDKEQSIQSATFKCVAPKGQKDLTVLPWHIYTKSA